ncbi:MAG: hypothetical protein PHE49_09755 [bacterium]|nr:hypothetical protein [bacterium]
MKIKLYFRVIAIPFLFIFLNSGIEAKSMSKVIVDIKWGKEPGMVGIDTSKMSTPSIDIDGEGNIYIDDFINKRINKYDSTGNLITTIPLLYNGNFAVSNDGRIYTLFSYFEISIYEKNGHFLKSYNCREAWMKTMDSIRMLTSPLIGTDEKGVPVIVSSTMSFEYYIFEITFLDSTCNLSPRKEFLGAGLRVTFPWIVAKMGEDGSINLINKTNSKESVTISPPQVQGYGYGFLGSDKKDNFYFYGGTREYRRIYKHDRTGKLIDSTDVLPSSGGGLRGSRLDKNGNFYELIVTSSDIKVVKYFFQ